VFGPDFEIDIQHFESSSNKYVKLDAKKETTEDGAFEKLTVYRINQTCIDLDGRSTIPLQLTFTDTSCDPIVIN